MNEFHALFVIGIVGCLRALATRLPRLPRVPRGFGAAAWNPIAERS